MAPQSLSKKIHDSPGDHGISIKRCSCSLPFLPPFTPYRASLPTTHGDCRNNDTVLTWNKGELGVSQQTWAQTLSVNRPGDDSISWKVADKGCF